MFVVIFCSFFTIGIVAERVSVHTKLGAMYGESTENTWEFLGIPYANVEKRWQPPTDLFDQQFENGEYEALQFGLLVFGLLCVAFFQFNCWYQFTQNRTHRECIKQNKTKQNAKKQKAPYKKTHAHVVFRP